MVSWRCTRVITWLPRRAWICATLRWRIQHLRPLQDPRLERDEDEEDPQQVAEAHGQVLSRAVRPHAAEPCAHPLVSQRARDIGTWLAP